jgi:hypothetical protein
MRTQPMLSVEVGGCIVRRPAVLEVLQYDRAGRPTISHMRPQLEAGEVLQERAGTIPAIIRTGP